MRFLVELLRRRVRRPPFRSHDPRGIPLKIAAKIDRVDEQYFRERIAPLLDQPGIEFIGEINEHQKAEFLGQASGLLFPIDWPEPFGLVMIEAMACGTPVLAFNRGSVSEIIEDGKTGIVVQSKDGGDQEDYRIF